MTFVGQASGVASGDGQASGQLLTDSEESVQMQILRELRLVNARLDLVEQQVVEYFQVVFLKIKNTKETLFDYKLFFISTGCCVVI